MRATKATIALVLGVWSASVGSAFAADAALIESARREGLVNWYTTQIVNQFAVPASVAFEKKYGIKVNYVRAENAEVMLRLIEEAKAGKVVGDVFDGTSASTLVRDGLVLKWQPDNIAEMPEQFRDPQGYWVATNLYVLTPGINTNLVPKDSAPKTYEDLLDPKWKGRMVWAGRQATSAAPGFIGAALASFGEERGMPYLRELSKQNIAAIGVSARVVLDQVIAGEYAIGLNIFNHNTTISAAQGAPTTWLPMNPSLSVFSIAGVTKGAPHPNAAKLLVDFFISEDGQKLYRDAEYISVHPRVPPRDPTLRPDGVRFKGLFVGPDDVEAKIAGWWKIYQDIFR